MSIRDLDIDKLVEITIKATEQVIILADQCQVDRDEAYQHFARLVMLASTEGTFKTYEVKKPSSSAATLNEGKVIKINLI